MPFPSSLPASQVTTRRAEAGDRHQWDQFVGASCGGILMQSWGWGELRQRHGWRILRLLAQHPEDGGWQAVIQVLHRPVGPGGVGWAYAPRGPALISLEQAEVARALLARARRELCRSKVLAFRMDPEWPLADETAQRLRARLHLRPAGFDIQHRKSWVVDLAESPELVLSRLPSSTRRNIRLAERAGVDTRIERTPEAVQCFYDLHLATVGRQGFKTRPLSYYQAAVEDLGAVVVIAVRDREPLAAAITVASGHRLIYLYGGTSASAPEARASYAMHWAMIQWGMARGCDTYDMWGVPRDFDLANPAHGYATFKTRWGGHLVSHSGLLLVPVLPPLDPLIHRLEARLLRSRPLLT